MKHASSWQCIVLMLAVLLIVPATQALPVFPGAIGFGTQTTAGRGGAIYRVTSLADSGPGTLREFLEKRTGPRTVLFEISGVIDLKADLQVPDSKEGGYGNVTVAGQTAPFPGITLKNGGLSIRASDVLIQHIAIRPGNRRTGGLSNRDCIKISAPPGLVVRNVVIDHVSCSWAMDETVSVWSDHGDVRDVTFIDCIFSDPIVNGEAPEFSHEKGSHAYGPLSGRNAANVSILRNIMAFCTGRNPLVRDDTAGAQVVNNFVYRPGAWPGAVMMFGGLTLPPHAISVVGNVIVRHPTPYTLLMTRPEPDPTDPSGKKHVLVTRPRVHDKHYDVGIEITKTVVPNAVAYLQDNRLFNPQTNTWSVNDAIVRVAAANGITRLDADPYDNSGGVEWAPLASTDVEAQLIRTAGKFPAQRDVLDAALIQKITTRTGSFLEFFTRLGEDPWAPVELEHRRTLALPVNPSADNGDGYTNLEKWLHGLAAGVEGRAAPASP